MARTKKRPYTGAKAVSRSCRCHGGCPWCESNRNHKLTKRELTADEQLEEHADVAETA